MKKFIIYIIGFIIITLIIVISILGYLLSSAISANSRESEIIKNVTQGYEFNIFNWERENFFDKWISYINPFDNHKKIKSSEQLIQYLSLVEKINLNENLYSKLFTEKLDLDYKIKKGKIDINIAKIKTNEIDAEIEQLVEKINKDKIIKNEKKIHAEQFLEENISSAIQSEQVNIFDNIFYVPVDLSLEKTPKLLVISPRDKIYRQEDKLLNSNISLVAINNMELSLLEENNLSAIVVPTGGVSTYPSIVSEGDLLYILQTAAHEWLHNYLALFPLGRSYFTSTDMQSINETICDIFGNEVGIIAYEKIMDRKIDNEINQTKKINKEFNFDKFMKETRLVVEKLLSEGKILESESFMDEQRMVLSSNGYDIRKINQAYFAFYGTYGGNPESSNNYYDNLIQIRKRYKNLGDMIHDIKYSDNIEKIYSLLE